MCVLCNCTCTHAEAEQADAPVAFVHFASIFVPPFLPPPPFFFMNTLLQCINVTESFVLRAGPWVVSCLKSHQGRG